MTSPARSSKLDLFPAPPNLKTGKCCKITKKVYFHDKSAKSKFPLYVEKLIRLAKLPVLRGGC